MKTINSLFETFGFGILIPIVLALAVGIFAQWKLYEKCNLPGIACIVPGWNVTTFLKIVGRPGWHALYLLIPVYNLYFIIKVYIELCNSFGKTELIDYILVIVFNGLYVLNLGLSYEDNYKGPVYSARKNQSKQNKSLRDFVDKTEHRFA